MHLTHATVLMTEHALLSVVADLTMVEGPAVLALKYVSITDNSRDSEFFLAVCISALVLVPALGCLKPVFAHLCLVITVGITGWKAVHTMVAHSVVITSSLAAGHKSRRESPSRAEIVSRVLGDKSCSPTSRCKPSQARLEWVRTGGKRILKRAPAGRGCLNTLTRRARVGARCRGVAIANCGLGAELIRKL